MFTTEVVFFTFHYNYYFRSKQIQNHIHCGKAYAIFVSNLWILLKWNLQTLSSDSCHWHCRHLLNVSADCKLKFTIPLLWSENNAGWGDECHSWYNFNWINFEYFALVYTAKTLLKTLISAAISNAKTIVLINSYLRSIYLYF
jgi:hypothetical protein